MIQLHSEIATTIVGKLPPGVWGRACADAVLHADFDTAKRILPGVRFVVETVGAGQSVLIGECADGSKAVWAVGLN